MFETCKNCSAKISFDEKGLNYKSCGRSIKEFMCIDCLAKEFKTTKEDLTALIEYYKDQGCTLFSCKKTN